MIKDQIQMIPNANIFLNLPILIRTCIVFVFFLFIILPLLLKAIFPVLVFILRNLLKLIYIIVSGFIIGGFQKIFGGVFRDINNKYTIFCGNLDNLLIKINEMFKILKKKYIGTRILIAVFFVLLVSLPHMLDLEKDSYLNLPNETYMKFENVFFGCSVYAAEPATTNNNMQSSQQVTNTPRPYLLVKVRAGIVLRMREYASIDSNVVNYLNRERTIYFTGEIIIVDGREWVSIITDDNIVGWVSRKYLEEFEY